MARRARTDRQEGVLSLEDYTEAYRYREEGKEGGAFGGVLVSRRDLRAPKRHRRIYRSSRRKLLGWPLLANLVW